MHVCVRVCVCACACVRVGVDLWGSFFCSDRMTSQFSLCTCVAGLRWFPDFEVSGQQKHDSDPDKPTPGASVANLQ